MVKNKKPSPALFKSMKWDLCVSLILLALIFGARQAGLFSPSGPIADRLMRLYVNYEPYPERAQDFVFIDIDADSVIAMGEPLITPRDKLVEFLKFATEPTGGSGPKAIIVDIALSHRTDELDGRRSSENGEPADKGALPNADQLLWDFLEHGYNGDVPIILARGFSLDYSESASDHPRPEPSFLDDHPSVMPMSWWASETAAQNPPAKQRRIFWAAPLYARDSDLLVRDWHLWTPWCLNGQVGAMPSVQLATVVLASDSPSQTLSELRRHLTELAPTECGVGIKQGEKKARAMIVTNTGADGAGITIDVNNGDEARRIVYTMPWHPTAGGSSKGRSIHMVPIPAHKILPAEKEQTAPNPSILNNRIVVIGASNRTAGDDHLTPIGAMPGAMILMNSIQSLSQLGTLRPVPWTYELAVAVVLIIVMLGPSYLFFRPIARIVSPFLVLLLAAFLSPIFIRQGLWLDTALAAAVLAWVMKLVSPLAVFEAWKDHKFWAWLHPSLRPSKSDQDAKSEKRESVADEEDQPT